MKIALIGYGAMGQLVGNLAVEAGHEIEVSRTSSDAEITAIDLASKLGAADVAIDFSAASSVHRNIEACMRSGVPLVEGTTGWNAKRDEIERLVVDSGGAMVFGANFSIGVNLFYRIAEYAAGLTAKFPEYEAFIEEQHHSRKKDAPSGTALKLERHLDRAQLTVTSRCLPRARVIFRARIESGLTGLPIRYCWNTRHGHAKALPPARW